MKTGHFPVETLQRIMLALLAVGFLVAAAQPSEACNRCRRFGTSCYYYKPTYVAPYIAPYVAPVASNVYVVQNSYPAPLVGVGGSQYVSTGPASFSSSVLPLLDPNQYFSQEMQLLKAANDTNALRSERTQALFTRAMELQAPAQERLAAGQAASMVLTAAGLNPSGGSSQGSSQAVIINRDAYGKVTVLPLTAQQTQGLQATVSTGNYNGNYGQAPPSQMGNPSENTPPPPPISQWANVTRYCYDCHGQDLAQPKGEFFIGSDPNVAKTMEQKFFKLSRLVSSGAMPPSTYKNQPTREERAAILNEIEAMIVATTVPTAGPTPPQGE